MFDAVSGFRCVFISVASLGPDVVLAVLSTLWQWHLRLLKLWGFACHFCNGGALFFLIFLLDVLA